MDRSEKILTILGLSGAIVSLLILHQKGANNVQREVARIPDGRLGESTVPGNDDGAAYLTSALPLKRRSDDILQVVGVDEGESL